MVTINEIKQVLHSLPKDVRLSPYGNEIGEGSISKTPDALFDDQDVMAEHFNIERMTEAIIQISYLFKPAQTRSKWSSYGGKHFLEKDDRCTLSNKYITNGDFIVAMILSGYSYKFAKRVNCIFKAKQLS